MDRNSIRHLLLLAVLLGPTTSPAGDALAAPGDKRTLVVRGRVTDAQGWPVAGARVVAEGSRRLKATADDAGQYVLNLALGSGADLARQPVSLRVHAERRGWRFALPSGEAEMGLDLRVVAGPDGMARCEVRANQTTVGSAVVRALTTDGDAMAVAAVNFLGVAGEEIGSPPALDLPLLQSVTLAGVHLASPPPVPIPAPPKPRAVEKPAEERAGGGTRTVIEKPAEEKPPAREPPKSVHPAGKAAPDTARAFATAKSDAKQEAKVAKEKPKGPTEAEKAVAREAARRLREEAKAQDRLAQQEREAQKAREKEEARERRTAATDTVPPPVKSLDRLAGSPAHPQHRSRALARTPLAPRRDTVAMRPPRELPAPPPAVSPVLGAGATGSSPVRPKPDGEPRSRSAPLVIRAPGSPPPAVGDSCTCRIVGTIEVDWDKPLPARTRVVVSLNGYPAIADTVELFMGSPRGFALPAAPCGLQHLRLVNLGSLRFDVVSREALAGFRCESGALRQFRIVLRPR